MAYLRNSTLITGPNTLPKVSSTLLNSGTSDTLPSSPHFSQSNGFVERAIQTVKKSLKKAHDGNEDLYLTLLILNTTPGADGVFPAMRLFNHQPRTILPSLNMTHTSSTSKINPKEIVKSYNQHAKDLPDITPGTVVRMRIPGEKQWNEIGKVVEKCPEPRAYRILNSKGNIVRRNRRHLLPCKDNSTFKMVRTIIRNQFLQLHNKPTPRPLRPYRNLLMAIATKKYPDPDEL